MNQQWNRTVLPILLDESAISRLLPLIDARKALHSMFAELAKQNAVQPAQTLTLFPNNSGDVITYQGVLAQQGVFGAKLSPYIVNDDGATVTAWTCLMSMVSGQPLLLCDAARLTTERTAAATALAVDLLSHKRSSVLCIIGSGNAALAHWQHVKSLRNWQEVRVWSPHLNTDENKCNQWRTACSLVHLAESAESAADGADVVLLCTSSATPVLDSNMIADGALVTSISTNAAQAHEVQPEFLTRAQVYCDYQETTPDIAGEMQIAERDHAWNANCIVGDLPHLVAGQCDWPHGNAPIFFRSLGLGLEDVAIANEIYRVYIKQAQTV